ncbi:hypothetical protein [Erwinia sp. S38]|nr:hypothetical protein [Erwinia sp. S38]
MAVFFAPYKSIASQRISNQRECVSEFIKNPRALRWCK